MYRLYRSRWKDKLREGERVLSPGMKYRHYAPKAPVILLDGELSECIDYIRAGGERNIALLCYSDDTREWQNALPHAKLYELGRREDELSQAHNLFTLLRETDKENFEKIYAPLPEKDGIGLALYNRLIRASAHTIINLKRCKNNG